MLSGMRRKSGKWLPRCELSPPLSTIHVPLHLALRTSHLALRRGALFPPATTPTARRRQHRAKGHERQVEQSQDQSKDPGRCALLSEARGADVMDRRPYQRRHRQHGQCCRGDASGDFRAGPLRTTRERQRRRGDREGEYGNGNDAVEHAPDKEQARKKRDVAGHYATETVTSTLVARAVGGVTTKRNRVPSATPAGRARRK